MAPDIFDFEEFLRVLDPDQTYYTQKLKGGI
jgi:hypothetical protein